MIANFSWNQTKLGKLSGHARGVTNMNISRKVINSSQTKSFCSVAAILTSMALAGLAHAAPLPSVVSTPVGAGVQSAGGLVSAAAQGHAGVAPTFYGAAPSLEPFADGVTNGLQSVGAGLSTSGKLIQSGGLALNPVAGAQSGVQTLRNGTLVQVRAGSLALGKGSPNTIVGVGALTATPPQGALATAGVANANALLNANVAPQ
jgi:hypothetical protein